MEKKYRFYEYNGRQFRVALSFENDSWFGERVYFEVTDSVEPPKNIFQKIKQFFTIKNYGSGTWDPSCTDEDLNNTIIDKIGFILYWEEQEKKKNDKIKKEWEEI